jgi:hypothetical protein
MLLGLLAEEEAKLAANPEHKSPSASAAQPKDKK